MMKILNRTKFTAHLARLAIICGCLNPATNTQAADVVWQSVGGAGQWGTDSDWSTGSEPTANDRVFIDNGILGTLSQVLVNGNEEAKSLFVDFQQAGNVDLEIRAISGASLTLNSVGNGVGGQSVLDNDGLIRIFSSSRLDLQNDVQLQGNGTIELNGGTASIRSTGGGTITQANGHTIQGSGRFLDNSGDFVNNGTVIANIAGNGALNIDPLATFDNRNGILQATNDTDLQLTTGNFLNTGSTIEILDAASEVKLQQGAVVDGGTLKGGRFTINGNGAGVRDITVDATSTLDGITGSDFTFEGAIQNNGTIGNLAAGTFVANDGTTISGNGVMDVGFGRLESSNGGTITNDAGHTIRDGRTLLQGTANMVNNGTVEVLGNNGSSTVIDPLATFDNRNGVLRSAGNGRMIIRDGEYLNAGSTISAFDATSEVELESNVVINGGTLDGAGLIESVGAGASAPELQDVTIATGSTVTANGGRDLKVSGVTTNNGTLDIGVSSELTVTDGGTLAGNGVVQLSNSNSTRILTDGTFTNGTDQTIRGSGRILSNTGDMVNQGTMIADGSTAMLIDPLNTFTNAGNLTTTGAQGVTMSAGNHVNTGTINVDNSRIDLDGSFVQTAGTTTINGTVRADQFASSADFQGGTLTGNASFEMSTQATVEFGPGATIAPGNSVGTIEFDGIASNITPTVDFDGTYLVELDSLAAFDQINVFGNANVADGMDFRVSQSQAFNVGDTFDIFTADVLSLAGAGIGSLDFFFTNQIFDVSVADVAGRDAIRLTATSNFSAVPEPSSFALLSLLGICAAGRRRRRNEASNV